MAQTASLLLTLATVVSNCHGAPMTVFDNSFEPNVTSWITEMYAAEDTAGVLALVPQSSLPMLEDLSKLNGHLSFAVADEAVAKFLGMGFPSIHLMRGHQTLALPPSISIDNSNEVDLWLMRKWTSPLTVVTMLNERALFGSEKFPTNIVLASSSELDFEERAAFRAVASEWWHAEDAEIRSDIPRFLDVSKSTMAHTAPEELVPYVDAFWNAFTGKFLKLDALANSESISTGMVAIVHAPSGSPNAREVFMGDISDSAALSSWVRENMYKFNPGLREGRHHGSEL